MNTLKIINKNLKTPEITNIINLVEFNILATNIKDNKLIKEKRKHNSTF